jgi:hypothetical protein
MKAFRLFLVLFGSTLSLVLAKEETEVPFAQCPAIVQARVKDTAQQLKGTIGKIEKEKTKQMEFYDAKIASTDGKMWSVKVLPDGKVLEIKEKKEKKKDK